MALGEAALGGERARPRQQELDSLPAGRVVGQESQCGAEPSGGAGGRAQGRRRPGLGEHGHRRQVPVARRELDVMRPRRRRCAARGEDLRAALVGAQQPAAGRALVHRPAHERMAEAEAPRDVGRAHEAELEQHVERLHGRGVVRAGRRGGEVGLERVAGDGRAAQHPAGVGGQERELLGDRCDHRARYADGLEIPLAGHRPRGRALRAGELLEVERVAARLLVEHVGPLASDLVAEERARRVAREAAQLAAGRGRHGGRPARAPSRGARAAGAGGWPSRPGRRRRAGCAGARPAAPPRRRPPSGRRRARSTSGRPTASRSSSSRTARWAR